MLDNRNSDFGLTLKETLSSVPYTHKTNHAQSNEHTNILANSANKKYPANKNYKSRNRKNNRGK